MGGMTFRVFMKLGINMAVCGIIIYEFGIII